MWNFQSVVFTVLEMVWWNVSSFYITRKENKQEDGNSTVYRVNYVVDGIGTVRCGQVTQEVKKGDIFFLFPENSYAITGNEVWNKKYVIS